MKFGLRDLENLVASLVFGSIWDFGKYLGTEPVVRNESGWKSGNEYLTKCMYLVWVLYGFGAIPVWAWEMGIGFPCSSLLKTASTMTTYVVVECV